VTSKLGRPLGRPRSRASFLGHPGTFAGEGWVRFPPPPRPPSSTNGARGGGLLTLTLRGKAMDGFEEQQERNRPQLSPPSLENRRTDAGFPQASTGRRRSVAERSLGLSFQTTQTLATQSTRPLNRGRLTPSLAPASPAPTHCWTARSLPDLTVPAPGRSERSRSFGVCSSRASRPG
jgi:hypothetical protein